MDKELQNSIEKGFAEVEAKLGKKIDETMNKCITDVQQFGKVSDSVKAEIKELNEQIKTMAANLLAVEQAGLKPAAGFNSGLILPSSSIISSDVFASFKEGNLSRAQFDVQLNTIIGEEGSPQTPGETIVAPDRIPGIYPGAMRKLRVLDTILQGKTGSNQVKYTRELLFTSAAAEREEAASSAESTLTFEQIDEPVRNIATHIPVSVEVLDDAPALASHIDVRLRHATLKRLDSQILNGDGTGSNLVGLKSTARSTAFTPESGDNQFDGLSKAKYSIIASDYEADAVILNPADWGAMERLKISSSDDRYLIDSAKAAVGSVGGQPTVWDIPVVLSNACASGKFHMITKETLMLFVRQDAVVEMFYEDADNAKKDLVTVRAKMRAALASFAPAGNRYGSLTL